MNKEISAVILSFETILNDQPWFGGSVYEILGETDSKNVFIKPNGTEHSLADLLWHMNTWADFTLKRIQKDASYDLTAAEKLDWRTINPKLHSWKKGIKEFTSLHTSIIKELRKKEDTFLEEKVEYRNYNFRFLLNGLVQHDIYHLGQMAYLNKMLAAIPAK
jgi:uncharacterized damage-inducible protein DinB